MTLDELQRLSELATPGPYTSFSNSLGVGVSAKLADVAHCNGFHEPVRTRANENFNAAYIAAACNMAPRMIEALRLCKDQLNWICNHGSDADAIVAHPALAAIRALNNGETA